MVKSILMLLVIGSLGFAATLEELKANLLKLEESIKSNDKLMSGLITSKTGLWTEISKGCEIPMVNLRQGNVNQVQKSCTEQKFGNQLRNMSTIDKLIEDQEKQLKGYMSDYNSILKQSRKDLKPEELTELMSTGTLLNRTEMKHAVAGVKAQLHRADLQKQQAEFEDSMAYAFTSSTIVNTLNSPLLCQSITRCPTEPNSAGTLTDSDVKKAILNKSSDSAVKKVNNKKNQAPSK